MPLIYVIEDDAAIRNELIQALKLAGFNTAFCTDFANAATRAIEAAPDLVLLDLTLPQTDGQFVCREIRAASQVPIIVLTSRATEVDEVMSMTLGADDFVTKPYRSRVLVARIQALLRRAAGQTERNVLTHNGLSLDLSRSIATSKATGKSIELTKNELRILALLMSRAGRIVPRADIMQDLWESEAFIDDNTLTININRLRGTLEKIGVTHYLVTHRGQGYSV